MLNRLHRGIASEATKAPEIDVAGTAEARCDCRAQIVDVREPEEWVDGHIPGATHIPLGELVARASALDPDQPVIAVCRSGVRSLTAAEILIGVGFADAKSMTGGMIDWAEAGHPVEGDRVRSHLTVRNREEANAMDHLVQ